METLDEYIKSRNAAYCLYASADDADMRYLTAFTAHDPIPVVKLPGRKPIIIVPQMEVQRASQESDCEVISRAQAGFFELYESIKDPFKITARMIKKIVGDKQIIVPPAFPSGLFCAFGEDRPQVDYSSIITSKRSVKTKTEINKITEVQRATEKAMTTAVDLIKSTTIKEGALYQGETPLTSDLIRWQMHLTLLSLGCTASDTIVSCGDETAMPHCTGSSQIKANEPIVIDIFPKSDSTGYYADMTRTLSMGEPSREVTDLYNAVREAVHIGEKALTPGISGSEVHNKVKDYFEECGYHADSEGFIHSLGHGVGLEVHEQPSLSPSGGILEAGNVVTIEPGLYYHGIGGVRIENLLVVTRSGSNRITKYPEIMVL